MPWKQVKLLQAPGLQRPRVGERRLLCPWLWSQRVPNAFGATRSEGHMRMTWDPLGWFPISVSSTVGDSFLLFLFISALRYLLLPPTTWLLLLLLLFCPSVPTCAPCPDCAPSPRHVPSQTSSTPILQPLLKELASRFHLSRLRFHHLLV